MTNLQKSISMIEGDPIILPFSKTSVKDKYWKEKHPGIAMGQIKKDTLFGKKLYEIAKDPQYKTYLDIGTWCGLGTTKCFLDGIITRDNAKLYAVESNVFFYETTDKYWSKYFEHYDVNKEKFNLFYGTLVPYEKLSESYKTDSGKTKDTYDYNQDIKVAPLLEIKEDIDVICFDGGHFSTVHEWNMFKNKAKVVILDDTKTSKTRMILDEITKSKEWKIFYNNQNDGGNLIAKKFF